MRDESHMGQHERALSHYETLSEYGLCFAHIWPNNYYGQVTDPTGDGAMVGGDGDGLA